MKWKNEHGVELELRTLAPTVAYARPSMASDLIAALRANPEARDAVIDGLVPRDAIWYHTSERERLAAAESRALAAEKERDAALAKVAAFERKPWRQSTGIACDFCGGPIPEGGEGHPEICPSCIKNERKTEALREERDAALAKLAEVERERDEAVARRTKVEEHVQGIFRAYQTDDDESLRDIVDRLQRERDGLADHIDRGEDAAEIATLSARCDALREVVEAARAMATGCPHGCADPGCPVLRRAAPLRSALARLDAKAVAAQPSSEFHTHDEWFWQRLRNGSVRVMHRDPQDPQPTAFDSDDAKREHREWYERNVHIMSAGTWASVVACMGATAQDKTPGGADAATQAAGAPSDPREPGGTARDGVATPAPTGGLSATLLTWVSLAERQPELGQLVRLKNEYGGWHDCAFTEHHRYSNSRWVEWAALPDPPTGGLSPEQRAEVEAIVREVVAGAAERSATQRVGSGDYASTSPHMIGLAHELRKGLP